MAWWSRLPTVVSSADIVLGGTMNDHVQHAPEDITPTSACPRWGRAAFGLVGLGAAGWFLGQTDLPAIARALRHAAWPAVAAAAALNLAANTAARALRWRALLPDRPRGGRVGLFEMGALVLVGQASNNVLPLRAGEAVRTFSLRDRHGYPLPQLVAAQVAEKVVELLSMVACSLPLLLVLPGKASLPRLLGLACAAVASAALLLTVARRAPPLERASGRVGRALARLGEATRALDRPRAWAESFFWSLASDGIDLLMIGLCLAALGIGLGPPSWSAVLLSVNLATALPSSPAQVGVHEAGAVFALSSLGVEPARALAFAVIYHAAHIVPTTLAGGLSLALGPRTRRLPA